METTDSDHSSQQQQQSRNEQPNTESTDPIEQTAQTTQTAEIAESKETDTLVTGLTPLLSTILTSPTDSPTMDGIIWRFHPGRTPVRTHTRSTRLPLTRQHSHQSTQSSQSTPTEPPSPLFWADRTQAAPAAGHIRPLSDPETASTTILRLWWSRDRTLKQWVEEINRVTEGRATSGIVRTGYPADYEEQCWSLLNRIQHERWLARKVVVRLRNRVWMKRTQCNIDLVDMEPVADRDAMHLTDTKHKVIYRFHRRDLFSNLISNLTAADEMLPNPRPPTNPYTNAPLTLAQTIAICQALITDYAARGRCPPILFAAFCAAGYNIDIFIKKNSSLLAQQGIQSYFKDITPHNIDDITDTMVQLLTESNIIYSRQSVHRWLRQTPCTPLHREWLNLARDYTLYMNLHVQTRDAWISEEFIHADVRRLFERTPLPASTSTRVRTLQNVFNDTRGPRLPGAVNQNIAAVSILPLSVQTLLGMPPPVPHMDDMADAMTLLQLALLGPEYSPQNRTTNQSNGDEHDGV